MTTAVLWIHRVVDSTDITRYEGAERALAVSSSAAASTKLKKNML